MHNKAMHLNHPETICPPPVCGKMSSTKPVPGAKKVGERCPKGHKKSLHTFTPLRFECITSDFEGFKTQTERPRGMAVRPWAGREAPGKGAGGSSAAAAAVG